MTTRRAPALSRLLLTGAVLGSLGLGSIGLGGVASAPAQAAGGSAYKPYAKIVEKDSPLIRGCHHYSYRYRITPPTDQWTVQLFLKNPNGHGIASAYIDSGSDPASGKKSWLLCKASTVSGRYHVKIKVTYSIDDYTNNSSFAKPTFFRLTRPDGTGR